MPEPTPIEKIVYQPVLLSYLDVLGFRDRIDKTKESVYELQQTYALLHTMKEQYSSMRRFGSAEDGKTPKCLSHFRYFSDLVVRITELKDKYVLADYLNFEFLVLAGTQCHYVCAGDLLRGAMVIGDLFIDDNVMFGPALVEAYEIERAAAVFPRIVIDKEILRRARYGQGEPIWNDLVTRGEDGVYFIDYLFGTFLERWSYPEENQLTSEDTLLAHKDFIEELLKKWVKDSDYRKRQKALWMAHYHNTTVKRLQERLRDSSLKLDWSEMEVPQTAYEF